MARRAAPTRTVRPVAAGYAVTDAPTSALIDDAEAAVLARRVIGDPDSELLAWATTPISHVGIIDMTGGLYRVTGRSRGGAAEVEWSCVLKVIVRPGHDEGLEPASWCYWRREAGFYGSDFGAAGRLGALRRYGVLEDGHRARVFMEHVDAETRRWRLEDFGRAARVAGESAGAFLVGRELPDEPWLSRGFLRSILADGGFWATTMDASNAEMWNSPPAAAFGAARRERVLGLWADRQALLAALDRLPQTFGHGDLHPRNLLLPVDGGDVVAVDWGFCGIFPVGNDLADLIGLAAWFCDIDLHDIPAVEAVAFAAYEDGLRSAGWRGDRRLVRIGYATGVALRMGICMPGWAALMLGLEHVVGSERLCRRPAEAILATWIALTDIWLDLADEASRLTAQLGRIQHEDRMAVERENA